MQKTAKNGEKRKKTRKKRLSYMDVFFYVKISCVPELSITQHDCAESQELKIQGKKKEKKKKKVKRCKDLLLALVTYELQEYDNDKTR